MSQQQMNMSGMVGMGGMNMSAGPGAPGGQAMSGAGTPKSAPSLTHKEIQKKFHTFIYDYFLKTQRYDLARGVMNQMEIDTTGQPKSSPNNRKEVNGIDDSNDSESKDDLKKPDDLPFANVPPPADSPFLWDWFCQFWDLYEAQRAKGSPASRNFLLSAQQRMMNERRMRADPQMQATIGGMRNGMMPNGMAMQNDMAKRLMMQNQQRATANPTPQQMQQMQSARMQMMQQGQMPRDGSTMDINGQQRPPSPGPGGDTAPSPKRQRLEGSFNGAPIGPTGRGQPQAMPGQQVEYSQGLRQHLTQALNSNTNKGMPGNTPVMAQGSPAMDPANVDFINGTQIRPGGPGGAQAGANNNNGNNGSNNNSNHALQDYQMQLMLLEQQNKKRLLMARQEQDNMTNGPGGPVPPGQAGAFAPATSSPQGSRTGLSPNSADQMKRGTPKMAQGVIPSPTPDGGIVQGRASPAPGFDPSQMNNMPQNMFPQMNKMGMMGPNGQMLQPPSSHPGMGGPMNQQQMEMFARAQQNGGRMPNGFMPPGPPQMMPGQPGPPMQQPPNMTPQQRNAAMPPPPAPSGDPGRGTQPSSPQQAPAPPTPSQGKGNAKGKKDNKSNKKTAAGKKGGTGATPVSEADQPPTPTPAPPITPTSAQPFPPKNGQPNQPPSQNPLSQPQPDLSVGGGPFGNLDGNDFAMNFDIGNLEGPDVLDNFDFDSFLNNEAGDGNFGFDASMGFDAGLEAGGDV